jgi:hypothetical protein
MGKMAVWPSGDFVWGFSYCILKAIITNYVAPKPEVITTFTRARPLVPILRHMILVHVFTQNEK